MGNIRHGNRFGMRHTEEAKKKIREAMKKNWEQGLVKPIDKIFLGENHHHSKDAIAVLWLNGRIIIKEYGFIREMAESLNKERGYSIRSVETHYRHGNIPKHLQEELLFVGTKEEYEIFKRKVS